ncbi:MAG: RHS repeat-associated core domain-containing protein [Armatimonadetes bacterium]|nr:RHS repeat-associated core domain-containing protein [Armatimonadota bacterium]
MTRRYGHPAQYDAWGNVLASPGTWKSPFGNAGQFGYQEDPDTGLKLLGHRYYDSSTGRFLTRDIAKRGKNWYSYCRQSPLTLIDNLGLDPVERVIKGFTKHGINQVIGREEGIGVANEAILDAIKNGRIVKAANGTIRFVGSRATVVMNADNVLVTAWPTSKAGTRIGSGGGLGVITTILVGVEVLVDGLKVVIKYRRRLDAHMKDIYDGGDSGDRYETGG